ncbi:beta-1,4-N-acetylgalactosaminyltransferase bre-4-like isoform X4 [Physella acuta]|nr:beta-1,4-N-acetylgalactosaminyltransferase bre-4-like isoform X4 [Physella acuta]XP_059144067.1 beta-1,4-N-acetylgalactosaminyltransferase bre-4-like isoform X4 [Physella acuta]XP_059144075.1 beta-1,4-N-acetylgalactosaminyltransferase bre-4-like isoform X4 [Physella acuta]
MMKMKKSRTLTEMSVIVGCFLLVLVSIGQILVFTHKFKNAEPVPQADKVPKPDQTIRGLAVAASAKLRARQKAQLEVRELEKALAKLMRENSMSPEEAALKLNSELYARRVQTIIRQAQQHGLQTFRVNGSSFLNLSLLENLPKAKQLSQPYSREAIRAWSNGLHVDTAQVSKLRDLNRTEESHMQALLSREETNISLAYEENFNEIKKQFLEGSELKVDHLKLKREYSTQMDVCPKEPGSLVGNSTDVNLNITVDINDIIREHKDVRTGGEWKPDSCISRHRVAVIIPYRDRWNHLKVLLHYLIPTLKRQLIHFKIFVVEQYGNETFNKGRIMNAAFREALKVFDFQCVTFHDVDLVPEDDRNMYSCTEQPKHMSISIDKFQYTLPYQGLVGGVLMFRTDHFQLVNGYSNMYWGWGAEDDDMTTRILHRGLRVYRPPSNIARYKMVKHEGRKSSDVAVRMKLLRTAARRSKMEGLNNVQYKLISTQVHQLFTHFIVDVGHP